MNSITKHLLNCSLLVLLIFAFVNINRNLKSEVTYSWLQNDVSTACYYVLSLITIVSTFPTLVFGFFGFIFCNQFPDKVKLKRNPLHVPFICFRIVTRGSYPELVKNNALRHIQICSAVGVKNFIVEIATENLIDVPKNEKIREVVVPKDYQTRSGALFKARVLQYCLEDHINQLTSNDWIVHLDEETIFTENCLRGIVNFIFDGKNQFGQGLITFINGKVVNWYTSLADSLKTGMFSSCFQFQFQATRKPLLGLNGSFLVAQVRTRCYKFL